MLQLLLPQENKFYQLLDELGSFADESAHQLHILIHATVENNTNQINESEQRISQARLKAKTVVETMTREICRTLITPFDREDMQELAVALYAIPKLIEKIKTRVRNHHLKDRNGDFSQFTSIIDQCATATEGVLEELAGKLHTKDIPHKVALLDQLEDKGDTLLESTLIHAFDSIEDTRELILRKGIYQMLESVTDLYRDSANIVLRIVLKHS